MDQSEGEYQRQRSLEDSLFQNMNDTGEKPSATALMLARLLDQVAEKRKDWHAQRRKSEPKCGPNQWRTGNRMEVIDIAKMEDGHLRHALRFAATKPQHSSRLGVLTREVARRG